jgi:hypothetical protein
LDVLKVSRYGEDIEIEAASRSFLHNQCAAWWVH